MKKILMAALIAAGLMIPTPAKAICTILDVPGSLKLPGVGDSWDVWTQCIRYDIIRINNSAAFSGSTTTVYNFGGIFTNRIGGSDPYGIRISSYMFVDAAAFLDVRSSMTVGGKFNVQSGAFVVDSGTTSATRLQLTNALAVQYGGTGRTTLNANALLYGADTSPPISLPVMSNGGLVIGTGGAPSTGTIQGTTNRITVTNGSGTITLTTPQDTHTGASPTFANMTISSGLAVSTFAVGGSTFVVNGGQVMIGTTSAPASTVLFTTDVTKGVLFNPMTTTQRDAIVSPANGLLIFNTSTGKYNYYNGGWNEIGTAGGGNMSTNTGNALVAGSGSITITQGSTFTLTTAQTNQSGTNGSTTTINEPAHAGGLWVVAGSTASAGTVSSWTIHGFDLYGTTIAFQCTVIACASGSNMDLNLRVNYDGSGNHHLGSNTSGQSVGAPGNECALSMQITNRAIADGNCGMAQFFVHPGMGPTSSKQTYMTGTIMNYGDSALSNQDSNPFSCRYDGNNGKLKAITFQIGGNDGSGRFYQDTRCTAIGQ